VIKTLDRRRSHSRENKYDKRWLKTRTPPYLAPLHTSLFLRVFVHPENWFIPTSEHCIFSGACEFFSNFKLSSRETSLTDAQNRRDQEQPRETQTKIHFGRVRSVGLIVVPPERSNAPRAQPPPPPPLPPPPSPPWINIEAQTLANNCISFLIGRYTKPTLDE